MVMVRFSRGWRVVLRMGHPLVRWSMQMMTHDGGKTTQFQGDHEGCRGSTTKFGGMWLFPEERIQLRGELVDLALALLPVLPLGQDEGVSHVLGLSESSSKLIPIHEESNHQIVHLFRLGKAQRTTH